MHVLLANKIYPPIVAGGAELIVSYLCEELVRRGHRVTMVSTCGPEMEPYPVEHRNGVESIRFFPSNLYWNFARGLKPKEEGKSRVAAARAGLRTAAWHLKDAWNRDAGRRLRTILEEARPDLLHTHLLDGLSASVWRAARRKGIPVIHTAHDYHLLCPRAFLLSRSWRICTDPTVACRAYRSWHLWTSAEVDLFASPSQFLLDLHVQAGLRSRKTAVVANGVPLPQVVRPPRHGPRNRFLMLSRLTVEKGVRVVLAALASLPKDYDIEVAFAGGGPLEAELREAAAQEPRIRLLGFVGGEEKRAALAWADHLILPSLWYENAPTVILEAAANGLTLIGSRIGGIPEFVDEGKTGLLFPPGDAQALAAAMRTAVQDMDLAENLQRHGSVVARRHTVSCMTDQYLDHYTSLIGTRAIA